MFSKSLFVSALVVAISLCSFGIAMAGTNNYPPGFISNLDHSTAEFDALSESMSGSEHKVVKQAVNIPAGVISNLDHTTAEIDAQLYPESMYKGTQASVRCNVPPGFISNLDHSTAKLDARFGC